MFNKHEQDAIVSNLRSLARNSEMPKTLLLAANEIEYLQRQALSLHKAGCDESERAAKLRVKNERLQAIVDSRTTECPPTREEVKADLDEAIMRNLGWSADDLDD